jgi:hypothetical protein
MKLAQYSSSKALLVKPEDAITQEIVIVSRPVQLRVAKRWCAWPRGLLKQVRTQAAPAERVVAPI